MYTPPITVNDAWVVWYQHWRYQKSTTSIRECKSRDDAFEAASYLEFEAEDCVNNIVGIEGPDGFIDLAEYNSVKEALDDARSERYTQMKIKEESKRRRTMIIKGPGDHVLEETWSDDYFDEEYQENLSIFGADRIRVVEDKK